MSTCAPAGNRTLNPAFGRYSLGEPEGDGSVASAPVADAFTVRAREDFDNAVAATRAGCEAQSDAAQAPYAAWVASLPDAAGATHEGVGSDADVPGASADGYAAVRAVLLAAGWITEPQPTGDAAGAGSNAAVATDAGATISDVPGSDDVAAELAALGELGRDTRTAGQRCHDALIEMARVLATNPTTLSEVRSATAVKAQVTITMDLDRLNAGFGAGTDGHGTALTAATIRRMCCDAALIPAVLGADGAILDWGRSRRLASPDQLRYLRQRDKGCCFPGCSRPPAWTEAHHLDEWLVDHGQTNVDRLALLCARHQDIVHAHHLKGDLIDGRVRWTHRSPA